MSVCRKLPDGTIQKIAGHTILLDANASEIRQGTWNISMPATPSLYQTTVTFTDPMPDTDYAVILEMNDYTYGGTVNVQLMVFDKTVTGFKIKTHISPTSAGAVSGVYTAFKPIKLEGYTELQNKVNNPDEEPTENSENLVKSGGVWEAIKNASSVFVGTRAEWTAATQTDYDIAVITDEHIILSIDKTAGTTAEQANLNKIWQGAEADWEALPVADKKVYDFAVIKDAHYILSVDKSTGDTTKVASLPVGDVIRNPDWDRVINVTTAQAIAGYTAPEDGILIDSSSYTNAWANGMINNVICDVAQQGNRMHLMVPVSKGDVYKVNSSAGTIVSDQNRIFFVPYKIADSISGRSPVGAVQAYYGASDPEEGNWLICDGRDTTGTAIELATAYPKLYRFLGNSNVLPDLRGEFLRGAGTNSHAAQGSGGTVRQHQDATSIGQIFANNASFNMYSGSASDLIRNGDSVIDASPGIANVNGSYITSARNNRLTVRPTNTSVNWIICAR